VGWSLLTQTPCSRSRFITGDAATYRWTDRKPQGDMRVDRVAAEDYETTYTSASILPFALYPYSLFKGYA
jgi:hypothetical protein